MSPMADVDKGLEIAGNAFSRAAKRLLGPTEALLNSILLTLLAVTGYVLSMIWDIGYTDEDLDHLQTIWEVVFVKAAFGGLFVFLLCIVYYKFKSGKLSLEEE